MEPNHPTLSALIKLHADLGGKIYENQKQAKKLVEDMRHVEHVIRLFAPDYDVRRIAAKRRYKANPLYKRGTVFRHVLDVLRAAKGPLTLLKLLPLIAKCDQGGCRARYHIHVGRKA